MNALRLVGRVFVLMLLCGIAPFASGCTAAGWAKALQVAVELTQGSDYLGSVIDVAERKADRYFDRHPNLEREREVEQQFDMAREKLELLRKVIAVSDALEAGDVERARAAALDAYEALRQVLDSYGILDATPPAGGAETDAPKPQPFSMPTRADMESVL
jgi:hypothetical protein